MTIADVQLVDWALCIAALALARLPDLLEILERYYPSLRIEVVNTDDREFRRALKQRETFMKDLITRLQAALAA